MIACLIAFAAAGIPYMIYKYQKTGSFDITGKKSILKMLGIGDEDVVPAAGARPKLAPQEMVGRVAGNLASSMSYPNPKPANPWCSINLKTKRYPS